MNANFIPVCPADELRDGHSKVLSTMNKNGDMVDIAIFNLGGRFYAISNNCVHQGGPLSNGQINGDIVTCPWHGWQYSVVNGMSPHEGGGSVNSYETQVIDGWIHVNTVASRQGKRNFMPHKRYVELETDVKEYLAQLDDGIYRQENRLRILGISTTNVTERVGRTSTSEELLSLALEYSRHNLGAQTVMVKLREVNFKHCQGYYSTDAHACIFPCSISEVDEEDQMIEIYRRIILWADVVLISTPIRWGSASSLYYKMVQRMNSVQNQAPTRNMHLIRDKVMALIITGGQDNVQHVAGEMMSFWSQTGFVFGKYPFVGWSRGWYAEDVQYNVDVMRRSLKDGHLREDLIRTVRGATEMAKIIRSGYDQRLKLS
jgi:nitrite reductase/ring-hydroxylating ferredoxin subunit/multimeric flavodoxin WrbA